MTASFRRPTILNICIGDTESFSSAATGGVLMRVAVGELNTFICRRSFGTFQARSFAFFESGYEKTR
jgi:hypothetical protein